MEKIKLPFIIEGARNRPLSFDPLKNEYIYYNEVQEGIKRIVPLDTLSDEQLINLSVERQLTNEPTTTVVLTGQTLSNEQLALEIKNQTKIGKQIFLTDINYLKYYLSQFPEESFLK